MRGLHWRSAPKSVFHYILLGVCSVAGMILVEVCKIDAVSKNVSLKREASSLALEAFQEIKKAKLESGKAIHSEFDPSESGLVGEFFTSVTSNLGVLRAKQTSINPNFAGLVLEYLEQAGVRSGDTVAVGLSGSFPALNICVYAAGKTMDLKLVVVSSLSSSQWGANDPKFLWPDMERILTEKNIFSYRSKALSLGGIEDRGLGISKEGREMLRASALRNGLPLIQEDTYSENLEERIRLYESVIPLKSYKAYINVGGGTVSVGTKSGSREFKAGLNLNPISKSKSPDSMLSRFHSEKIPVIHLVRIEELARENGFPLTPKKIPEVGQGNIFYRLEYNPILAGGVLVFLLILLYILFRTDSLVTEDTDSVL